MHDTVPVATFDTAYAEGDPPWVIGAPQPAVLDLERAGGVRGRVLDPGCGTGEHTIHLARLGYDVLGLDSSPHAVQRARANAADQGVQARFEVADALHLEDGHLEDGHLEDGHLEDGLRFDTVLDSALFHVFSPEDQRAYTRSLHRVCRPGATVHVLALADVEESIGPTVSRDDLTEAFADGWYLEDVAQVRYRGIAYDDNARRLGVPHGEAVDSAAWLARARRR